MRPQARLPQAVGGDGVRPAQRRAGEEDGPRQAVEQGDVIRGQAQLRQFVPAAVPSAGEGALNGFKLPEVFGQGDGLLTGVCGSRDERDAGPAARIEADTPPQTEYRVQHRAGGPRQACPGLQGGGVGGRAATPQEPGSVGLVFHRATGWVVRRCDVDGPDRLFVRGSRPAAGQQGTRARDELCLEEQLREGRVALIRDGGDSGTLRRSWSGRARRPGHPD